VGPLTGPSGEEVRVLAVDLGLRRIGLAVSDPLGLTAQGLPSLARGADPVGQVLRVCREVGATEVVVGLPLRMDGSSGPAAEKARDFAERLRERSGLAVHLWDERLSSVAAERTLIEGGVRRLDRRRRGLVDRGAAVLILQGFLDRRRTGAGGGPNSGLPP